jgi:hypothetical protein
MGIYFFRKVISLAGHVPKTAVTALPIDKFTREMYLIDLISMIGFWDIFPG